MLGKTMHIRKDFPQRFKQWTQKGRVDMENSKSTRPRKDSAPQHSVSHFHFMPVLSDFQKWLR